MMYDLKWFIYDLLLYLWPFPTLLLSLTTPVGRVSFTRRVEPVENERDTIGSGDEPCDLSERQRDNRDKVSDRARPLHFSSVVSRDPTGWEERPDQGSRGSDLSFPTNRTQHAVSGKGRDREIAPILRLVPHLRIVSDGGGRDREWIVYQGRLNHGPV